VKFTTSLIATFLAVLPAKNIVAAEARYLIPQIPLNPTFATCNQISAHWYHTVIRDINEQMSACMRQRPKFGKARWCNGEMTLHAWVQCSDIAQEQCNLREQKKIDDDLCRRRAKATTENRQRSAKEYATQYNNFRAMEQQATSAVDKANQLSRFINSPRKYLSDRLSSASATALRQTVFGTNGKSFDESSANEIYNALHDATIRGIDVSTSNPTVRGIQKSAFRQIAIQHRKTLQKLDEAVVEIGRFGEDINPGSQWRVITNDSSNRFERLKHD